MKDVYQEAEMQNEETGSQNQPTSNRCDSHEVVFYLPPSMQLSSHVITGGSVLKTIGMRILAHPFTLWQNSSLNLEVY